MPRNRVLVLLHKHDPYPEQAPGFIWQLVESWPAMGVEVMIQKGIDRRPSADLVIPHVDMTHRPPEYQQFLDEYPNVLNRHTTDISKRKISRHLVGPDDDWEGPVIVKTNLNYGGFPERTLRRRSSGDGLWGFLSRIRETLNYRITSRSLGSARMLGPSSYPIFESVDEVPKSVFENGDLVVERFFSQMKDGLYVLQLTLFLGDRHICARVMSDTPIVKGATVGVREEIPIPSEILALRKELGFDYGKFDFVFHEGQPVLLDANATPGTPPKTYYTRGQSVKSYLAEGIATFLESAQPQ